MHVAVPDAKSLALAPTRNASAPLRMIGMDEVARAMSGPAFHIVLQVYFFALGAYLGALAGAHISLPIAHPEPAPLLPPPAPVVHHQTVEHHHHHVEHVAEHHHHQGGDGDLVGTVLGGLLLLGVLGAIFGSKREDRR